MRSIRAILFDLDDTLWDVRPVIVRAEEAMHAYLARHYPRIVARHDVQSMREQRVEIAREHPAMRHDFTWLRMESLRRLATEAGYPAGMAEQAFQVFYRARNEVELYADVRPALERLCCSYRLFAISNGNAHLGAIGLDRYFEASLAAREAGMLKPDPRIFEILLARAGIAAHEAAHVGDDPECDVEGARAAGVLPVWLNRTGAGWSLASPAPDVTITTLHELPDALLRG